MKFVFNTAKGIIFALYKSKQMKNYKGYQIEIIPNGTHTTCLITKDGINIKGTFDPSRSEAIRKAVIKIELLTTMQQNKILIHQ